MKPNTMISAVLLALAIALHSTAPMAADDVIYPAINCQAYYGTQAGDFNIGSHGIRNNSSGTRLVSCPINHMLNDNYWTDAYDYVFVNYHSNSSSLTCFVYNMSNFGALQSYGISTGSPGPNGGQMRITINPRADTHYQSLFCLLPAGAILEWYFPWWS